MIVVIDYNVGNVKSVCNAFEHIGCEVGLSNDPAVIADCKGLVLPGVAAFGYAMNALGPLADTIRTEALSGKPLMGICLGHQLLFERSCEHGDHEGLGLIKGEVIPLPEDNVVPHMGWNLVEFGESMELFEDLGEAKHFYFAHSYHAKVSDAEAQIFYTEYGINVTAAVKKDSIYGMQFHPEKSSHSGLTLLKNFSKMCEMDH